MSLFSFGKTEVPGKKAINLALQGGGSHGAFTWGVLDRLLEDDRIEIEGISGVSAGSMNAVMLAAGLIEGGFEGAREKLDEFWTSVAIKVSFNSMRDSFIEKMKEYMSKPLSLRLNSQKGLGSILAASQFNPLEQNPLEPIVKKVVDFKRLQKESPVKLFIGATEVTTGKLRLFRERELTASALLASACLPGAMSKGVEVDGAIYWDGGFSSNPAIFPLIFECECHDIVTVLLGPLERTDVPDNNTEIMARISELTFNSTYLREMRAITEAKSTAGKGLISVGQIEKRIMQSMFHHIEAEALMNELSVVSKMNNHESFLLMLKEQGRARASAFLDNCFDAIGDHSSVDLEKLFL